jgi:hypothetical protein
LLAVNQSVRAQPSPLPFQYAAKFICGTSPRGRLQVLAQGTYFTSINIHNPFTVRANLKMKVAIELLDEEGSATPFPDIQIPAEKAVDFSCRDIAKRLGVVFAAGFDTNQRRVFAKGFVVIESKTELDVVAVYTTGSGSIFNQRVTTMNLERVPVRRLALPDLIPLPPTNGNFCQRDPAGRLIITVMNQGTGDASASLTRIEFGNGGFQLVATPAIPAGRSVEVLATFPASCFNPSCTFRIAADSTDVVLETNEGNNGAGGTCGS